MTRRTRWWATLTLIFAGAGCAVQPLTPTAVVDATTAPPATAVKQLQVEATGIASTAAAGLEPGLTPTGAVPTAVSETPTVVPSPNVSAPTATPEIPISTPNPTSLPLAVAPTAEQALEATGPAPDLVAPPPSGDIAAAEQYTIDLINAERAAAGVPPLLRDETLMGIARARVADMVARGYTGHTDPVTGQPLARAMIRAAGYTSNYLGENWYGTIKGPPAIVDVAMSWFMTDPPHAQNILSPNYVAVGVGIAFNGRQWLLVQDFVGQ